MYCAASPWSAAAPPRAEFGDRPRKGGSRACWDRSRARTASRFTAASRRFELQADAVSRAGAAAVLVPHGQFEDRRTEQPRYLAVNRWGVVPSLRHRGLTILQSNVILDYLARGTGISKAPPSSNAGRRANGCPGRPIISPPSRGCGMRRGSARRIPR